MKIIKITTLIVVTFLLGFITSILYQAFDNTVHPTPMSKLEINNKSSQNIKDITIKITDGSGKEYSTVTYFNLNENKSVILPMYFERDGSYSVTYILEDETIFTSGNGYVMRGGFDSVSIGRYGVKTNSQ